MAQQNSINNASTALTIDNGASTDSYIQYAVNGTDKWRLGVDFSDSNAFVLSQGSALGTNNTFKVTTAGEISMPLQPAFAVYNSSVRSNVTGDGTTYALVFDTEIFDQNSDFASNTFTAPVTGRYMIYVNKYAQGCTALTTSGSLNVVSSNRTYTSQLYSYAVGLVSGTNATGYSVIVDMDASDTVTATLIISNGSLVVDIYGEASTVQYTWICGYLIC